MPVPRILTLLVAVTLPRFLLQRDEQSRPSEISAPSSFRSLDETTGTASIGHRSDGIVGTSFGRFNDTTGQTGPAEHTDGAAGSSFGSFVVPAFGLRRSGAGGPPALRKTSFGNFTLAPPSRAAQSRKITREAIVPKYVKDQNGDVQFDE